MFHLINADPTTVSSSENSKETVIPSSSSVCRNPSVGPDAVPPVEVPVTGLTSEPPIPETVVPVVESPSASCANQVRITSPVKMPVSVPVSTSL